MLQKFWTRKYIRSDFMRKENKNTNFEQINKFLKEMNKSEIKSFFEFLLQKKYKANK